jgi:hypothetical protein
MMNHDVKTGFGRTGRRRRAARNRGRTAAGKVRREGKARPVTEGAEGRLAHGAAGEGSHAGQALAPENPTASGGRAAGRRTALRILDGHAAVLKSQLKPRIAGGQIVRKTCRDRSVPNCVNIDSKISLVIFYQL